ncbi:MAG: protein translocase subunit SecD [Verrucomicrobiota bacterium]
MNRSHFWKLALIVFVTAWAIFELTPPQSKNLLEEFQRRAVNIDTNFQAIVAKAQAMQATNAARGYGNIVDATGGAQITNYFPFVNLSRERYPSNYTRAILNQLQRDGAGKIKLGLDLQGGTSILVKLDTNRLQSASSKQDALNQAMEVMRKRVDRFGVSEPIIQPAGEDRILIQIPGLSEEERVSAIRQVQRAAFLEFRIVHPQSRELLEQNLIPPGYEILKEAKRGQDGRDILIPHLVGKKAEKGLTGSYVKRAMPSRDTVTAQPEITFEMTTEGSRLFGEVTEEHIGHQLAIVLDGVLYSAPTIQSKITSNGRITGNFDIREAIELANVLESPLQTPVSVEEIREVDPSLGKDSINSGLWASIVGTGLVALFMAGYYLIGGVVANIALMLNIVTLIGVMCSVGTTLTLPGIAGIVLTVGMSVDANVLIFERIREELAAGKSIRGAVIAGYDRAFGTILDSHMTTLISSIILIYMGTGPVKGFGVTLTIGVSLSLFTALVVTRLIFDFLLAKNWIKSLAMFHLIKVSNLDFMKLAKPAFITSWALIIIGCSYGVYRGKGVLGVDFRGGDRMTIAFDQKQKIDVDKLRVEISKLRLGDSTIQYERDIANNRETLQIVTDFKTSQQVEQALKATFPQAKFDVIGRDTVGAVVGGEIMKAAFLAAIMAMAGILVYLAFRYEFSFAFGAVIAIFHDIFMTLGWFFLSGRELSAPIVAAVLTIIGFSVNDTVVIFDRIREDLKLGLPGSFRQLMNKALNQTLSRTLITSGTVFLSTMALYIFGGGAVHDFAFTFLVGIITGTYSSIYIASAIVLWWHKGQRPKIGSTVSTSVVDATVAKAEA